LLVHGHEDKDVIPRSLQLIAGRTGQEYNQRKKRKGAFWEDRYHATAVDVEEHLENEARRHIQPLISLIYADGRNKTS
jgi:hypothetical protein